MDICLNFSYVNQIDRIQTADEIERYQVGSIPFTKYPEDIPDYVKQSLPEGYPWERIMNQGHPTRI